MTTNCQFWSVAASFHQNNPATNQLESLISKMIWCEHVNVQTSQCLTKLLAMGIRFCVLS